MEGTTYTTLDQMLKSKEGVMQPEKCNYNFGVIGHFAQWRLLEVFCLFWING
jgi:hypothetical protein